MTNCTRCGTALPAFVQACPNCGTPMGGSDVAAAPPAPPLGPPVGPAAGPPAPVMGSYWAPQPAGYPGPAGYPAPPESPPPPAAGRNLPGWVIPLVAVVAALALIGGVLYVVVGKGGGSSSPSAAAAALVSAVTARDSVAELRTIDPDEANFVGNLVREVGDKARQTGLLNAGSTLPTSLSGSAGGLNVSVTGLKTHDVPIAPDLDKVVVDAGTVTVSLPATSKALPEPFATLFPGGSKSIDLSTQRVGPEGHQQPIFVVTIKQNGTWYVSPLLTAVQYVADFVPASGADLSRAPSGTNDAATPDAAVQQLAAAGDKLNQLLAVLPATEARALDAFRTQLGKLPLPKSLSVSLSGLTDSPGLDGSTVVTVPTADVAITASDGSTTQAHLANGCVSVQPGGGQPVCPPATMQNLGVNKLQFVTVQENGQWKVSVLQTLGLYFQTAFNNMNLSQLLDPTSIFGGSGKGLGGLLPGAGG